MDEFDDSELSAALRERAASTRPPLDVGQAFESVRHRARRRRIRNGIAAGIGGAAAVAAIAIGVGVVTSDRDVVRTPVTAPPETGAVVPSPTSEPAITVDSTSTTYTHSTTTTTGPRRTTTTTTATTTTDATAGPAVPAVTQPYESVGGSITVRLADGRIALVGDPEPAAGFTAHVYDNGPDRVRVRFESATDDAEIRVDLVNGRLIPTIRNPEVDSSSGPGSGSTTTVPDASGDNSGSGSSEDNSGPGSGDNSGPGSGGDNSGSGSSGDNSGPGSG
jgi:hypothetical protein